MRLRRRRARTRHRDLDAARVVFFEFQLGPGRGQGHVPRGQGDVARRQGDVAGGQGDVPRSQVLTLRWIMREPSASDPQDGPRLDVTTTMRKAVPVLAASEKPVCCVEDGRVVGIVDREAVLAAIAQEGDATG